MQNKDYHVSYANNTDPGSATVLLTGDGVFNNSFHTDNFRIVGSLTEGKAEIADVTYTGNELSPAAVVTVGSVTLTPGQYIIKTNKKVKRLGTYTATILARKGGYYQGQLKKKVKFKVVPGAPTDVTYSQDGKNLYLVGDATGKVTGYKITVKQGKKKTTKKVKIKKNQNYDLDASIKLKSGKEVTKVTVQGLCGKKASKAAEGSAE